MRWLHSGTIIAISMAVAVTASPLGSTEDATAVSASTVFSPSATHTAGAMTTPKPSRKLKYCPVDSGTNDGGNTSGGGDTSGGDDGSDGDDTSDGDDGNDGDDTDDADDTGDTNDVGDEDDDYEDCIPAPSQTVTSHTPGGPQSTGAPEGTDGSSTSGHPSSTDAPTKTTPSVPGKTDAPTKTTPSAPGKTDEPSGTREILPVSSPEYLPSFDAPDFDPKDKIPVGPIERGTANFKIQDYPDTWKTPSGDHEEVQAAIKAIDWSHVPNAPVRRANKETGDLDMKDYDVGDDEHCWWSATGCVKPKAMYLPEDAYKCDNPGDWGLTFDDGPLNPRKDVVAKEGVDVHAEPYLYDFLAGHGQASTLFYVGSNVATYPEAAKRAFDAGHHLCLHTWSHVAMTTLKNEEVVAELYWALRAVKEATGVTSRCWRPPYGDVDDRVRAIAHQMGLATILWDRDSNDWKLESKTNKGELDPATVDGYFKQWIGDAKAGNDTLNGHIGLQHELNEVTIGLTEKWLPELIDTFTVKPIHDCTNVGKPYWELD